MIETDQPASNPDLPGVGALVQDPVPEYPEKTLPFGKPEGVTGIPGDLPNYQQDWNSGDAGPGLSPKPTKWDKVVGGIQQGARGSMLWGTLPQWIDNQFAKTGQTLSPEDANKLNPYRATPYTTPVDAGVVAMEAADAKRQQDMQEWLGRNNMSGAGWGRFAGALADIPLYAAIGGATGFLGDAAAGLGGEIAGGAGKLAGRYGWALGEFSGVGEVQNKLEAGMGAKEKPFYEVVQDNLGGAAIATGLGMLYRRFKNSGEANPEAFQQGVKGGAVALGNDEKLPSNPAADALAERRNGVGIDPDGEKFKPTVKTAPLEDTPLYTATHGDGTPLVHEHGLGEGKQFTDSYQQANNGVSKSSETPGQIAESKLPAGKKLLDLDQPASQDYGNKEGLLKAIEEKIGIPLEESVKNGESLKEVITSLGDYAGAEIGDKTVPEDIIAQIQETAKAQGYVGYQFNSGDIRQVHMFDPKAAGMEISNVAHSDPSTTPDLPSPASTPPGTPEEVLTEEKSKSQNFSPNVQEALNQIRKTSMTLHPDDLEQQIADNEKVIADHKQQLMELAKDNPQAEADMKEIKKQEVRDQRMLEAAKQIMNCGASE